MKKTILFLSAAFIALCSFYISDPVGKMFPTLTGETYAGKNISIPAETKGKFTLIGMAYSKGAEGDLKTWIDPIYNKFIIQRDTNNLLALNITNYDVNLYFIPVFTGLNQATAKASKKKIREETDKELLPHLIFYEGDFKTYKEQLGISNKDIPYFYVLDKTGKIIYMTSGKYTDEKMEAIEDLLN